MDRRVSKTVLLLVALLGTTATAQKIKVIVDQDARGPGTSDQQALLVFLQSDKFEVLGITTVSGDQWVREETQHVLRMLEVAGRTDVPVVQGAEFPLLNSKEETERWEALYGKFRYKGCWSDFSKRPGNIPPAFRAGSLSRPIPSRPSNTIRYLWQASLRFQAWRRALIISTRSPPSMAWNTAAARRCGSSTTRRQASA